MPLLQGYKKRKRTQKISETEYIPISEWTSSNSVERDNGKTVEESISSLETSKANLASPTLTGTPKAPTATAGTNTTQLATTAFTQTAVSNHNSSVAAHGDIRDLIAGLTTRLNTALDSDDVTLDQMSEIVAYIKANKSLIESITTSKVNVSDIINTLTSTAVNRPLSANQGKVLKDLIDTLTVSVGNKVDKVSGKGLSTNDLTATLKSNYDSAYTHSTSAHAPSNAERNIVTGVQKNGADLTPDSTTRKVNVTVPTKVSELTNDSGYKTTDNNTTYSLSKSGSIITLTGSDGSTTTVTDSDTNTTYGVATQTSNGLESAADKKKLDGIATGAEVNQNAFSNVKIGTTNIAADTKTDTIELVAGTNVTITPDATNDKITISSKDTVFTHPSTHPASMITGLPTSLPANGGNSSTVNGHTVNTDVPTGAVFTDTKYTLPAASSSALGGVKTGYTASGKNYPVVVDTNNNAYVNVPWTDTNTNTTYTASTGLTLSGTAFSVNYGSATGTACQGNDSRLSDSRTPKPHTHTKSEITDFPTIPSVGNGTVTITQNGTTKGTFTMNQSGNTTVALTDTNTDTNTWIAFKGATTSAAGTAGYLPAPSAGATNRCFMANGTWAVPTFTFTSADYVTDADINSIF